MKNKIIIIVEGGVVIGVRSEYDDFKVKVEILDADTMDSEEFESRVEAAEVEYPVEIL